MTTRNVLVCDQSNIGLHSSRIIPKIPNQDETWSGVDDRLHGHLFENVQDARSVVGR